MRRLLGALATSLLALALIAGHGSAIAIASHTGGGGDCGGGWKNDQSGDLRDGCPGGGSDPTTTTTTVPTSTTTPATTTTTPATTTTAPPVVTTTAAAAKTPTKANTTTSTSTTTSTTTTTTLVGHGEVVAFLVMPSGSPPNPTPEVIAVEAEEEPVVAGLDVSLGSTFVGLTVDAITFPALAFLVPAAVAIWLSFKERRRKPDVAEADTA